MCWCMMSDVMQVDFMKRHSFAYEALAGEEYESMRPDLVKVQESIGNIAFAAEIKQSASRDAFFKAGLLHHPHQLSLTSQQLSQCIEIY